MEDKVANEHVQYGDDRIVDRRRRFCGRRRHALAGRPAGRYLKGG
jgi:hypothetical protein